MFARSCKGCERGSRGNGEENKGVDEMETKRRGTERQRERVKVLRFHVLLFFFLQEEINIKVKREYE